MADLSNNSKGEGAPTGEDAIRDAVENSRNSDESNDDDSDDDDSGDDDNSDDDNSGDDAAGDDDDNSDDDGDDSDDSDDDADDDAESGDKKDPKSGRKFSQFKGDGTDKAYISNLEEGYKNSSAEAIRIKGELETTSGRLDAMLRVVAASPELSKALNDQLNGQGGGSGSGSGNDENSQDDLANPFIANLQAEWQEKSEKEIQEIIDGNPELITDEALGKDVKKWMAVFSAEYRKDHGGRLMSGGDAMIAAMKHLGIEDKREKQDLANGAKKNLTPPRSRGNKAKKSGGQKPKFTDSQIAMAKSMGKDEAWLQKNAG